MRRNKHLLSWLTALVFTIAVLPLSGQGFNSAWCGRYEGPLKIWQGGELRQELRMRLEIRPLVADSNWMWEITYVSPDVTDLRSYELVRVDSIPGRYRIDEKNDIVLDADLNDQVLFSRFDLGDSWITATYRFGEDSLEFEIFSGNGAQPRITGGVSEEVPEVKVFPLTVYQRAVLARMK